MDEEVIHIYTYTHTVEYDSAIKRNFAFCNNLDGLGGYSDV